MNAFSNMSYSVIFYLQSFNLELILNNVELYSLTVLKSYNLKCIQSYLVFGKITIFWWSYISFNSFHGVKGSFTVRYSFFQIFMEMVPKKKSVLLHDPAEMFYFLLLLFLLDS